MTMLQQNSILSALFLSLLVFASCEGSIIIDKAEREINAVKYIVTQRETLDLRNAGSSSISDIQLCYPNDLLNNRPFFEVVQGTSEDAPELEVSPVKEAGPAGANASCQTVVLERPLQPGKKTTIETYSVLIHQQMPRPKQIEQADPQRVLLSASRNILSPYRIASQSTQIKVPSKNVESYTGASPVSKSGATVTYGPDKDVAPLSPGLLTVHFENNSPFAEALSCVREISVSHWGNVYVEEYYTIKHTGAQLKGEWSRLKHQTDGRRFAQTAIREFIALLPRTAHSLYFRDEIGNVSTSSVRRLRDKMDVRLQPRFPLLGGWQVEFVFGYSLPLSQVITPVKGDLRQLSIPFSSPIQGLLIKDLTVKVVLPEGSTDIKASLPLPAHPADQSFDKKHSYLDTLGRPVLVLRKQNVVPDQNLPLDVTYRFSGLAMLQEPLLLVSAFFAVFCMLILYGRCEFSLSPHAKQA